MSWALKLIGLSCRAGITYTLVKLSVSASAHGRVVSPVDLGDLVPLDVLDLVHGDVSGERDSQVVAESQDLTTLVLQVVDQLRVLAVFTGQDFL